MRGKSDECSNFANDQGERWGHMATKLRLWQLTQYERVLYLDADTIFMTGPVDEVFSTITTFAAEALKYHSHFNAGVLLLTPSEAEFQALIALGKGKHAGTFGNLIDGTEQGLNNSYFNGAPGREVTKLPIGRADVKGQLEMPGAPWAVYWITHVCAKPWRIADGAEELEAHFDASVYAYWQRIWDKLHADLVAAGVAGLTVPTETQVTRLIRPSAEKPRAYLASERTMVGEKAAAISAALSAAALPAEKPSTAAWHVAERKAKQAIATLLTPTGSASGTASPPRARTSRRPSRAARARRRAA